MEPDQQNQFFQYGTFGVFGLALIICLCYVVIFANPQVPFNPFKPPTRAAVAATLRPTFTPPPTRTLTRTPTAEPTQPATDTPLPTDTATATPRNFLPTPTRVFVPPRPATPRPPTIPPPPAATPRPSFILTKQGVGAPNCGTWYLSGTIWGVGGEPSGTFVPGTRVQIIANGRTFIAIAGETGRNSPGYWEMSAGAAHVGYNGTVAIVDASNNLLSPQYPFSLTANCTGAGAVNQITMMDFTKQQ